MIILNDVYKFPTAIIEDNSSSLTLKLKYDSRKYSDFRNFCGRSFFQQSDISIKSDKKCYTTLIESSSFSLGSIEYNENEEIQQYNPLAEEIIRFKKETLQSIAKIKSKEKRAFYLDSFSLIYLLTLISLLKK